MTEGHRNFLIGLVSLGAVIGLIAIMFLFGELDRFVVPRYVVTINTDHASGLRRGSSVEFNGVPIGVIDDVTVRSVSTRDGDGDGDRTGDGNAYPVRVSALIR